MVVRTPSLVYIYISLSTWYQSQGRKPNSFLFFRVINSGKPSGDRVSFRSPCFFPVTFPISQYFPVSRIVARNHSPPAKFSGDLFFRHRPYQKERLEEISTFCEDTSTKRGATRRPRAIFGRRLHLTRRRVGAREAYSGHFRHLSRLVRRRLGLLALRQSSPSPASPFCPCFWLPCHSGHLRQGSPSISEAWVLLLFLSRHVTNLFSIDCTSHSRGFTFFLSPPKSEPILGLSSIQIREYDHQKSDLYLCYLWISYDYLREIGWQ